MKAIIHYFTGTGNTGRAASIIKSRLEESGREVALRYIGNGAVPPREVPDLTVVVFPIYSWAAPSLVLKYVKKMPASHGAVASIFACRGGSADIAKEGGFAGQGIEEVEKILVGKGYDVALSMDAGYPDSWVQAVNPPSGKEAEAIIARGDARVEDYAAKLVSGERFLYRCNAFDTAWSKTMALLFRSAGRRMMSRAFIADSSCTACGLCAKACPVEAITLEGKEQRPRWNLRCENCCRCINICPESSIQVSLPLLLIHLGLNAASVAITLKFVRLATDRLPAALSGAPSSLVAALLAPPAFLKPFLIQITLIDRALFELSGIGRMRDLFSWSHTRSFTRYKAPGFKPPLR